MVNSTHIVRGRIIPMREISDSTYVPDSAYVPQTKRTVAGVDSAIVIVVFAALAFWTLVGVVVWKFL